MIYVVTASLDPEKTRPYWQSWQKNAAGVVSVKHVVGVMGVVPAFYRGVEEHFLEMASPEGSHDPKSCDEIIALFHDDLRIDEKGWDKTVEEFFLGHPKAVLAGFGGAYGIGRAGMYDRAERPCDKCRGQGSYSKFKNPPPDTLSVVGAAPSLQDVEIIHGPCEVCGGAGIKFDPMTLARHHFMSNMEGAEAHGERVHTMRPVACLDGFSLIGRAWFIHELLKNLTKMQVLHHAYDAYAGILARQKGLQTWLLPVKCHHHGGMTAVGSADYNEWAQKHHGGDQEIWRQAHRAVWEAGRDVLPFDVREEPR